jgi:hypothetical protein
MQRPRPISLPVTVPAGILGLCGALLSHNCRARSWAASPNVLPPSPWLLLRLLGPGGLGASCCGHSSHDRLCLLLLRGLGTRLGGPGAASRAHVLLQHPPGTSGSRTATQGLTLPGCTAIRLPRFLLLPRLNSGLLLLPLLLLRALVPRAKGRPRSPRGRPWWLEAARRATIGHRHW